MKENKLKKQLEEGGHPVVGWMWTPSPLIAEIMASAGFDAIGVDLQHGSIEFNELYPLFAILAANDITPMVRVPDNDRGAVTRVLDAGAYAVICPDVQTAEEAKQFAELCKYPPAGVRGFGPVRPAIGMTGGYSGGGGAYPTLEANDTVMAIVQIESTQGLENVEEIMATEGVDAVFPGPVDYSLSAFGEAIMDLSEPRMREPLERIFAAAKAAGKPVGMPCFTPSDVTLAIEMGAGYVQMGNDVGWITAGSRGAVQAMTTAIAEADGNGAAAGKETS